MSWSTPSRPPRGTRRSLAPTPKGRGAGPPSRGPRRRRQAQSLERRGGDARRDRRAADSRARGRAGYGHGGLSAQPRDGLEVGGARWQKPLLWVHAGRGSAHHAPRPARRLQRRPLRAAPRRFLLGVDEHDGHGPAKAQAPQVALENEEFDGTRFSARSPFLCAPRGAGVFLNISAILWRISRPDLTSGRVPRRRRKRADRGNRGGSSRRLRRMAPTVPAVHREIQ